MNISSLSYWFWNKGPEFGSLVYPDRIQPIRFRHREDYQLLSVDIMGYTLYSPGREVTAHTCNPVTNHTTYKPGFKTDAEAVEYIRKAYTEFKAEADAREADPVKKLDYELARHDWYYDYSDDGGVWRAGESHWKLIRQLLETVPVDTARELWAKYAPGPFTCPV